VARLDTLDLEHALTKKDYKPLLKAWQLDLLSLQQSVLRSGMRVILNVEGMDAAGKGGALRRIVQRLDPRGYRVHRIGAPDPENQAKHYLYRFWTRIPGPGELIMFDRSWYGRVLVERVEGIASPEAWQRAYGEINDFERTLVDDDVVLVKLWFHIDPDEQLRRFEKRLSNPFKSWKMTDEDWRNRDRWNDYINAAEDMFVHTGTDKAPWTVVPANNKFYARLIALRALVEGIRTSAQQQGYSLPELHRKPF